MSMVGAEDHIEDGMDMEIIIRYSKKEEHQAEKVAFALNQFPIKMECTNCIPDNCHPDCELAADCALRHHFLINGDVD